MAKKRKVDLEEEQRQSRKQMLLARRQERQTRQVRLAILGIVGLIGVVILIGIFNEFIFKPNQPVATVNGVDIALKDWQERVRLQRAQLIIAIEDLAESFGQDIGQVQQFAGQQINLLSDPETLGQLVLDQLIEEELVRQGTVARGISVNDAEIQKEIEQNYNYFGGDSPTPAPTSSPTIQPTPSLTLIPTAVITEVLPTSTPFPTASPGPTMTPLPSPTPVSQESFQESYADTLSGLSDLGSDEAAFREVVRAQLLEEKLIEALAVEEELSEEALHASFFYIAYQDADEAQEALEVIENDGFLTYWNTVRSRPIEVEQESTAIASELIWRTRGDIENLLGEQVAEVVFDQSPDEVSEVLVQESMTEEEGDRYYIVMVSGRERRPLSQSALNNAKQEILLTWLEAQRSGDVEIFERWRSSVPRRPVLDPRFRVPPTPVPVTPTVESTGEQATPDS